MIHLIYEKSDGAVIKGLSECTIQSATSKQMVDTDLNHGVIKPGSTSEIQVVSVRTFSWATNGDPVSPITDVGLYIDAYYSVDPTYTAEDTKSFCGDAATVSFGDYDASGGSHSPASDLNYLFTWGDNAIGGIEVSFDLGRTYTTIKNGTGSSIASAILVSSACMDKGSTNGQLEPGDRARIYMRIKVPSTFTDPTKAGVYLFTVGMFYNYTE
jgi:hypothetical protein